MGITAVTNGASIRLLALIEASTVTGPARNLLEFCQRTRKLGQSFNGLAAVNTSIVTFQRGADTMVSPFVAAAQDAGIPAYVIDERYRFDTRVITALRRIVERSAPNIIQTHNVKSHFLVRMSGLAKSRPWVAFHHGYTATDWKMLAYNKLDRWSLPAADRVVTVSQVFARDLSCAGVKAERISVLHNSINSSRVADAKDEEVRLLKSRLHINDGERVVVVIGRLSREKGQVDLIAALGHLNRIQPRMRVKLMLVGEGPERERIWQAAALAGLSEQVIFAGQVNDVRPFYAVADLMALPSHSEGSPNVLLEAMAARLPVVATEVGGVPEIVTHGESALLVAPRDPRAMAEAINSLLVDARLARRLAGNARDLAIDRHSPESRLRSLLDIYRGLVPAPHAVSEV